MPLKKRSSKSAKVGGKPRSGSSRSKSPSGKKRSKSARTAPRSHLTSAGSVREREPDILDPPAMENLYYIAHGPVDALEIRGFCWEEAPKGKKGKKGKKRKK